MIRACLNCGKEFTPRTDHLKRGFGFYCSRSCHYEHKRSLPVKPWEQRFWSKADKNGPLFNGTPCWNWLGGKDKGYGRFAVPREGPTPAYRVSYLLTKGEIPEGMEIDHLCRNHGCINPDHLEAVTYRENLMRGNTLTAKNAAKTHCLRGHEFTPENTYMQHGWRQCRTCRYLRQRNRLTVARLMRVHYEVFMGNPRFWYERNLRDADALIVKAASELRQEWQ